MHKIRLIIVGVAVLLLAAPEIAYASDCPPGGALDCYSTVIAALLAVVAVVAIIAVIVFFPEIVGVAAVAEAADAAAVGAEVAEAAAAAAEAADAAAVAAEAAEAAEATEVAGAGEAAAAPEGIGDLMEKEGILDLPDGPTDWPENVDGKADDVDIGDFDDWPGSPSPEGEEPPKD